MSSHLHSLTLVRLFAASWVVCFHAYPHMPTDRGGLFERFCGNGSFAMPLFFMLSGLVLAFGGKKLEGKGGVRRFYQARFARIFPAYATVHLLGLIFMVQLWTDSPFSWWFTNFLSAVGLQAWFPESFNIGINNATWSISVEVFLYLCFPMLLPALTAAGAHLGRLRLLLLFVAISSLIGLSDLAYQNGHSLTFYVVPVFRLPDFCIGVILGTILRESPTHAQRTWIGLTAAIAVFAAVSLLPQGWWGSTLFNVRAKGLVTLAICGLLFFVARIEQVYQPTWRALPLRVLIYLGEASYSLFLIHVVLIKSIAMLDLKPKLQLLQQNGLESEAWIVFLVTSLVATIILHEGVEKPAQRWLRKRNHGRHNTEAPTANDLTLLPSSAKTEVSLPGS